MTATLPPRSGVRRRGVVYGYDTLRPETGYTTVEVGYVGRTRQALRARDGQHREVQPWADIIVGGPYVIAEGWWTDEELAATEVAHIARLRPRYNIEDNRGNPARIPPWGAVAQRQARDAARGAPAWVPPRRQGWLPVPSTASRWRPWQVKAALWGSSWALLAAGLWVQVCRWGASVGEGAAVAALGSAALHVWGAWLANRPRRRRRRCR